VFDGLARHGRSDELGLVPKLRGERYVVADRTSCELVVSETGSTRASAPRLADDSEFVDDEREQRGAFGLRWHVGGQRPPRDVGFDHLEGNLEVSVEPVRKRQVVRFREVEREVVLERGPFSSSYRNIPSIRTIASRKKNRFRRWAISSSNERGVESEYSKRDVSSIGSVPGRIVAPRKNASGAGLIYRSVLPRDGQRDLAVRWIDSVGNLESVAEFEQRRMAAQRRPRPLRRGRFERGRKRGNGLHHRFDVGRCGDRPRGRSWSDRAPSSTVVSRSVEIRTDVSPMSIVPGASMRQYSLIGPLNPTNWVRSSSRTVSLASKLASVRPVSS